jgi:hypothetical protein
LFESYDKHELPEKAENLLLGIELNLSMLCLAQNMYARNYNVVAQMHEAWQQFIFWKKSINYQRAMRRMDEIRITIMIIVW